MHCSGRWTTFQTTCLPVQHGRAACYAPGCFKGMSPMVASAHVPKQLTRALTPGASLHVHVVQLE